MKLLHHLLYELIFNNSIKDAANKLQPNVFSVRLNSMADSNALASLH